MLQSSSFVLAAIIVEESSDHLGETIKFICNICPGKTAYICIWHLTVIAAIT